MVVLRFRSLAERPWVYLIRSSWIRLLQSQFFHSISTVSLIDTKKSTSCRIFRFKTQREAEWNQNEYLRLIRANVRLVFMVETAKWRILIGYRESPALHARFRMREAKRMSWLDHANHVHSTEEMSSAAMQYLTCEALSHCVLPTETLCSSTTSTWDSHPKPEESFLTQIRINCFFIFVFLTFFQGSLLGSKTLSTLRFLVQEKTVRLR